MAEMIVKGTPVADSKESKPETKPYTLKPGKKHYQNGVLVQEGAVVQLTAKQYKAFGDKFEPASSK